MSISRYLIRRISGLIPILIGILVITFIIARIIPGDPAALYAGPQHSDPETLNRIREMMGLNKPIHEQLIDYIVNFFVGNWGFAWHTGHTVIEELARRFPVTLELSLLSMFFAITVGVLLGVLSAIKHETKIDYIIRGIAFTGIGIPSFWLGLLLIFTLGYSFELLPLGGLITPTLKPPPRITGLLLLDSLLNGNINVFIDVLTHLIMPVFCLGYGLLAHIIRLTRVSVLEILQEPYISVAKAKGLPKRVVLFKHALRNALIPLTSWSGMTFGYLLGGSIAIEYIFGIPGIGSFIYESIIYLDYAPILASVLIMVIIYFIINFIVDILYAILDPRIRLR